MLVRAAGRRPGLRGDQDRRLSGREIEDRAGEPIGAEIGIALEQPERARRLRAERHAAARDRVAADIVERAAAGLGLVADVVGVAVVVAHQRLHAAHRADLAAVDQLRAAPPIAGDCEFENASSISTPVRSRTAISGSASRAFIESGFSHSTCLPACIAFRHHSMCRWLGSGM